MPFVFCAVLFEFCLWPCRLHFAFHRSICILPFAMPFVFCLAVLFEFCVFCLLPSYLNFVNFAFHRTVCAICILPFAVPFVETAVSGNAVSEVRPPAVTAVTVARPLAGSAARPSLWHFHLNGKAVTMALPSQR